MLTVISVCKAESLNLFGELCYAKLPLLPVGLQPSELNSQAVRQDFTLLPLCEAAPAFWNQEGKPQVYVPQSPSDFFSKHYAIVRQN